MGVGKCARRSGVPPGISLGQTKEWTLWIWKSSPSCAAETLGRGELDTRGEALTPAASQPPTWSWTMAGRAGQFSPQAPPSARVQTAGTGGVPCLPFPSGPCAEPRLGSWGSFQPGARGPAGRSDAPRVRLTRSWSPSARRPGTRWPKAAQAGRAARRRGRGPGTGARPRARAAARRARGAPDLGTVGNPNE